MNPRISGRRGQVSGLDVDFYHNGVLADPFAIRRVDIYKNQVLSYNLVTSIPLLRPSDALYPLPVVKSGVGEYTLPYTVPADAEAPAVYFDVWYYFASNPCGQEGTAGSAGEVTGCDIDDSVYDPLLLANCHRFYVYPDNWFTDDRLQSIQFGFEPLQIHFHQGDRRWLEIGLMPLPLYDFDYNLVMPLIPFLTGTIHIETRNCETLVDSAPMEIAIRQGSYRTNPFVLRYLMTANDFLIGTYRYRVTITLPNGIVQASPWYNFTVR